MFPLRQKFRSCPASKVFISEERMDADSGVLLAELTCQSRDFPDIKTFSLGEQMKNLANLKEVNTILLNPTHLKSQTQTQSNSQTQTQTQSNSQTQTQTQSNSGKGE